MGHINQHYGIEHECKCGRLSTDAAFHPESQGSYLHSTDTVRLENLAAANHTRDGCKKNIKQYTGRQYRHKQKHRQYNINTAAQFKSEQDQ